MRAACGARVALEGSRTPRQAARHAAPVGRDVVEAGPAAALRAALERARAVGEARPEVRLEEGVVVGEVEARRLVGERVSGEHAGALGGEVEPTRIDDHAEPLEVGARWQVAPPDVDERDLPAHRLRDVTYADLGQEDG